MLLGEHLWRNRHGVGPAGRNLREGDLSWDAHVLRQRLAIHQANHFTETKMLTGAGNPSEQCELQLLGRINDPAVGRDLVVQRPEDLCDGALGIQIMGAEREPLEHCFSQGLT